MTIPWLAGDPLRDGKSPSMADVTRVLVLRVKGPNSKSVVNFFIWVTILRLVGDTPCVGGMVGDLDDHKISSVPNFNSVQNLRPLGAVEADNSYNL